MNPKINPTGPTRAKWFLGDDSYPLCSWPCASEWGALNADYDCEGEYTHQTAGRWAPECGTDDIKPGIECAQCGTRKPIVSHMHGVELKSGQIWCIGSAPFVTLGDVSSDGFWLAERGSHWAFTVSALDYQLVSQSDAFDTCACSLACAEYGHLYSYHSADYCSHYPPPRAAEAPKAFVPPAKPCPLRAFPIVRVPVSAFGSVGDPERELRRLIASRHREWPRCVRTGAPGEILRPQLFTAREYVKGVFLAPCGCPEVKECL